MKELQVDTLKTGYRFSQPVFIDENNILVPAMIPIKQKDLDRLKKWKIHVVRTAGDLLPCEGQGEAGTDPQTISFANYLKSPVQKEILTVYTGMLENFRRLQAEIKAQRPVEAAEVTGSSTPFFPCFAGTGTNSSSSFFSGPRGRAIPRPTPSTAPFSRGSSARHSTFPSTG